MTPFATKITLKDLSEVISNTRRLVIFVPDRFHAKLAEKLCSRHKRSVVASNWGLKLASLIRTWEAHSESPEGLVMILNGGALSHGWRGQGDIGVWLGHVPEQAWIAQASARLLDDLKHRVPFHHCYPSSDEIYAEAGV